MGDSSPRGRVVLAFASISVYISIFSVTCMWWIQNSTLPEWNVQHVSLFFFPQSYNINLVFKHLSTSGRNFRMSRWRLFSLIWAKSKLLAPPPYSSPFLEVGLHFGGLCIDWILGKGHLLCESSSWLGGCQWDVVYFFWSFLWYNHDRIPLLTSETLGFRSGFLHTLCIS